MKRIIGCAVALAVLVPSVVDAQEGGGRNVAITVSPVHLAFPVVEVTGEYRVQDKLGVAGILGIGTVTVEVNEEKEKFTIYEAGASLRYYLLGDFDHGLQLGAEALFVQVDTSIDGTTGIGQGLIVGPFIGYKVVADFGLTFDGQLGYAVGLIAAEASNDTESASSSDNVDGALLNLNVGWSF